MVKETMRETIEGIDDAQQKLNHAVCILNKLSTLDLDVLKEQPTRYKHAVSLVKRKLELTTDAMGYYITERSDISMKVKMDLLDYLEECRTYYDNEVNDHFM